MLIRKACWPRKGVGKGSHTSPPMCPLLSSPVLVQLFCEVVILFFPHVFIFIPLVFAIGLILVILIHAVILALHFGVALLWQGGTVRGLILLVRLRKVDRQEGVTMKQ